MRVKEERQSLAEVVHVQACGDRRLDVFDAVGQREGQFLSRGRARFPDVITADADGVEVRNRLAAKRNDVGRDPHRSRGWINVRPPGGVLFENVVLHGPG